MYYYVTEVETAVNKYYSDINKSSCVEVYNYVREGETHILQ